MYTRWWNVLKHRAQTESINTKDEEGHLMKIGAVDNTEKGLITCKICKTVAMHNFWSSHAVLSLFDS